MPAVEGSGVIGNAKQVIGGGGASTGVGAV